MELNAALGLLAGFWILNSSGPKLAASMKSWMSRTFESLPTTDLTQQTVVDGSLNVGMAFLGALAPILATILVVGVISNLVQVGLMFSQTALAPDFNRINPLTGLKRIFSARGMVELLKSLLKLTVIGYVVYAALSAEYPTIASSSQMDLTAAVSVLSRIGGAVGMRGAAAMLIIAMADYMYQRFDFEKNLRMTRQELIEEMKRYENQEMKARIRSRQRQMALSRMMAAIPKADVVITNPTHLAIALRYEKGKMQAPTVVAKGQRLVAERIKEKAREHNVPLVENKPLARALFKSAEVGQEIPIELYQAVAEVLAFVMRLRSGTRLALNPAI